MTSGEAASPEEKEVKEVEAPAETTADVPPPAEPQEVAEQAEVPSNEPAAEETKKEEPKKEEKGEEPSQASEPISNETEEMKPDESGSSKQPEEIKPEESGESNQPEVVESVGEDKSADVKPDAVAAGAAEPVTDDKIFTMVESEECDLRESQDAQALAEKPATIQ